MRTQRDGDNGNHSFGRLYVPAGITNLWLGEQLFSHLEFDRTEAPRSADDGNGSGAKGVDDAPIFALCWRVTSMEVLACDRQGFLRRLIQWYVAVWLPALGSFCETARDSLV